MTGIRGIAALWVMIFHAQQYVCKPLGMPYLVNIRLITNGWRGVDLFFMLSGFVLMYAHGTEFRQIRKQPLIRFARLRFTRVYPLNAVVTLLIGIPVLLVPAFVAWARSRLSPTSFSLESFVRTMFLATRWFIPGSGGWNGPTWSLSLEVLGYVMFPWLAFCAIRITNKWLLIALPTLLLLGAAVILKITNNAPATIEQIAIVRMASCFATGIALYRLWALAGESEKNRARWITAGSAVAILILCSVSFVGPMINFCFAALLYGLAFQRGIINSFLASRVVVFLGEISFPLYLAHFVPLLWLRYYLHSQSVNYSNIEILAWLLAWAVGCIVVATLLHYFVEAPFHKWGRRWAGERVAQ
jgi:peptidoglycan/LPS O-acetylase OafA/YrhL